MSLLLYGIIYAQDKPDRDTTLSVIKAGKLSAIVAASPQILSREPLDVLAYGQCIQAIHQQVTIVPMRYGSILADEDAVKDHLHENKRHYRKRLNELNQCDEIGIRLTINVEPDSHPMPHKSLSGLHYLLERKRAQSLPLHIEQLADLLNTTLLGLYKEHSADMSVFNGQQTYLISYLVPRIYLTSFMNRLNNIRPDLLMLCSVSGPWPPYSFAN
jgi:hypothetical protein